MRHLALSTLLISLLLASPARALLYAVNYWEGELWTLKASTGAVALVGATGADRLNGLTATPWGTLLALASDGSLPPGVFLESDQLIEIDPRDASILRSVPLDFGAATVDPRSLAMSPDGRLFAVNLFFSELYEIDPDTGVGTLVGALHLAGGGSVSGSSQVLEFSPAGELFSAVSIRGVVRVDPVTAEVTDPWPVGNAGGSLQSLAFTGGGNRLFGVRDVVAGPGANVFFVDQATGAVTAIHTVAPQLRGLAYLPEPGLAWLGAIALGAAAALRRRAR